MMIRGEIQLTGKTQEDLALQLEVLAKEIRGSCRLDEPNGEHKFDRADYARMMATFTVLEEYRDGDIEKFFGCDPDFTGKLSTAEFTEKIRGEDSEA